jgi:hypothetical protein
MNLRRLTGQVAGVVLAVASLNANADVIASTDFDGRTVNGDTASNLLWVTNGIDALGDLTANKYGTSPNGPFGLFDTNDTADLFAVNRNLNDEGPWFFDVALNVLTGSSITLDTLSFDAMIFNNSGRNQNVQRFLSMSAEVFDASGMLFNGTASSIFASNGALANGTNTEAVSFDLSNVLLNDGQDYTLRIRAFGDLPLMGNNAGIDNFSLTGTVANTPVSAPGVLGLMGLACLMMFRRRLAK